MFAFLVHDMTCGHCVTTITQAIKGADKDAEVRVDLASHRVEVVCASLKSGELAEVIRDAGYTPVPHGTGEPAP